MGYYVNPRNKSKEQYIEKNASVKHIIGECLSESIATQMWNTMMKNGDVPLILVDNGYFTALAVAYKFEEFKYFLCSHDDTRPKTVYGLKLQTLLDGIENHEIEDCSRTLKLKIIDIPQEDDPTIKSMNEIIEEFKKNRKDKA